MLGSYILDWWGRKKTLTFAVGWFIIGNIIQITAMNSWVHITIGRMVAGLGVGSLSIAVPLYMSETSVSAKETLLSMSRRLLTTFASRYSAQGGARNSGRLLSMAYYHWYSRCQPDQLRYEDHRGYFGFLADRDRSWYLFLLASRNRYPVCSRKVHLQDMMVL